MFVMSFQTISNNFSATNEDFSATNEDFSATNEDFSATNEDFSATNEDFSATNEEFVQNPLADGFSFTTNGDVNYSTIGSDFESKLLELDSKMVTPDSDLKAKALSEITLQTLDSSLNAVLNAISKLDEAACARAFELLFRYMFFIRSIRVPGKKSRLLFYYMLNKLYVLFPQTVCALLKLIPEYGYFGDLDYIITEFEHTHPDLAHNAIQVYIDCLNVDCNEIWGKPIETISLNEATQLNQNLKTKSTQELRDFVGTKQLSLAAKWMKREGKKNSQHRNKIINQIYNLTSKTNRRTINYYQMLFRNIITSLTQCLVVGEQMMCETNTSQRTWADIPIDASPATFITKYRKALANEKISKTKSDSESESDSEHIHDLDINETGDRYPNDPDRVQCRYNLMEVLAKGQIKGASQDLHRLSNLIFTKVSSKLSITRVERTIIAQQWNDLVSKIISDVNEQIEQSQRDHLDSGLSIDTWIDPRNVIPVIDTSGSMCGANVQGIAIGLGILATHLSKRPGVLISFSDRPEKFTLCLDGTTDVFDHFLTIIKGPTGYNTNIDATFSLLMEEQIIAESKDFAILILTDGQFDSPLFKTKVTDVLLERISQRFAAHHLNIPRIVFWNLNGQTPGFPATSLSRGVQLVSGYSQTIMIQVFTGNYIYEIQPDGTTKINVSPWDTFVGGLIHSGYDKITEIIKLVNEDNLFCNLI